MHTRRVHARGRRLHEHAQRLQGDELLARDGDAAFAEEEIVFLELSPRLSDEENGIAGPVVPQLNERSLRPLASLKSDGLSKHVEALGGELHQAIGPRKASKRDSCGVEVPPVVHVVLRYDDDRKSRVGMVVEVDQDACRDVGLVFRERPGGAKEAAVRQKIFGLAMREPALCHIARH